MFAADGTIDLGLRSLTLGPLALLWVVINVRMVGARAFSKMTAFDFVITVAIGSLLASAATVSSWPSYIQALAGISLLLATQYSLSRLRVSSSKTRAILSNNPALLMRDGLYLDDAMASARITREDVQAKLREANAYDMSDISAVILETTGDISVIHGGKPDTELRID
ncbi:MAG: YetF domain-containing protein [Pseudomonadota bacterium]